MHRKRLARAAVVTAAAAGAVTAMASTPPPSAFGHARQGTFELVSGAVLDDTRAYLMGTFSDPKRPCTQTRRIRVDASVTYLTQAGQRKRVNRSGAFTAVNCAEGGPNRGFTLSARSMGLACPNGSWKRGNYSFVTETRDVRTKLRAVASLLWREPDGC
ncbi:MAG: hypothetical protein ABR521_03465 [Gaiellaceae bacterium]